MSPMNQNKKLHPEIENLLSSSRKMFSMKAGTSNLGHDAFKILRDTNLMRFQQQEGANKTQKQYEMLRDEMNVRKTDFDKSVSDYKLSLVRAQERKRKIQ